MEERARPDRGSQRQNHLSCDGPEIPDLVSVVVPAFNAAATIEATIHSVLAQTHTKLEVIVVDDGSRDETAELVRTLAWHDARVRLVQKPNGGLAAARNTGIERALGALVCPLDADDLWHPTKLEKQLAVLRRAGPQTAMVYCFARAVGPDGRVLFNLPALSFRGDVFAPLLFWNFVPSGAPLLRRACVRAVGGYDPSLRTRGARMCEDLDFNLALAERYDVDLVPEFLVGYTIRPGSMSTATGEMMRSRAIVVREARARHPELPGSLFRWAAATNARECSREYLRAGAFRAALGLLLKAALTDPAGTFHPDTGRLLAGGALDRLGVMPRVRGLLDRTPYARLARTGLDPGLSGLSFLETEPAASSSAHTGRWAYRRLQHLANFKIARQRSDAFA